MKEHNEKTGLRKAKSNILWFLRALKPLAVILCLVLLLIIIALVVMDVVSLSSDMALLLLPIFGLAYIFQTIPITASLASVFLIFISVFFKKLIDETGSGAFLLNIIIILVLSFLAITSVWFGGMFTV